MGVWLSPAADTDRLEWQVKDPSLSKHPRLRGNEKRKLLQKAGFLPLISAVLSAFVCVLCVCMCMCKLINSGSIDNPQIRLSVFKFLHYPLAVITFW